jgi:hypothetical protein
LANNILYDILIKRVDIVARYKIFETPQNNYREKVKVGL